MESQNSQRRASLVLGLGIALFVLLFFGGLPTKTRADTISVMTQQVLPAGQGNNCPALPVYNISSYVYDGELHSFEFTVADPSYVALIGSAGNVDIPFNHMARRMNPDGTLRVIVGLPTMQLSGTLPIQITLLSSPPGGQITCLSVISISITGPTGTPQAPSYPSAYPSGTYQPDTPKSSSPTSGTKKPDVPIEDVITPGTSGVATRTLGGGEFSPPSVTVSLKDKVLALCAASVGARNLWLVLIVALVLIAVAAAFVPPQHPSDTQTVRMSVVVIATLALLALWYVIERCRVPWAPWVTIAIGLLGLAGIYRDTPEEGDGIIVLPAERTDADRASNRVFETEKKTSSFES